MFMDPCAPCQSKMVPLVCHKPSYHWSMSYLWGQLLAFWWRVSRYKIPPPLSRLAYRLKCLCCFTSWSSQGKCHTYHSTLYGTRARSPRDTHLNKNLQARYQRMADLSNRQTTACAHTEWHLSLSNGGTWLRWGSWWRARFQVWGKWSRLDNLNIL